MRSKQEIETQLAHFKNSECGNHGSEENEIWIKALEWVLGTESHRLIYNDAIATLVDACADDTGFDTRHLRYLLSIAVDRLR